MRRATMGLVLVAALSLGWREAAADIDRTPFAAGIYGVRVDSSPGNPTGLFFEGNSGRFPSGPLLPAIGVAGQIAPNFFNDYEVFDLSGLPGPITALTLSGSIINLRSADGAPPFTDYHSIQVGVSVVGTPLSELTRPHDAGSTATADGYPIFLALQSGRDGVGFPIDNGIPPLSGAPTVGSDFRVQLSAAAVADAEAARLSVGYLVLGFTGSPGSFSRSEADIQEGLTLSIRAVPEPSSLVLLAGGLLGGLGDAWRRRRARAAA
jgi:hypothetical protein